MQVHREVAVEVVSAAVVVATEGDSVGVVAAVTGADFVEVEVCSLVTRLLLIVTYWTMLSVTEYLPSQLVAAGRLPVM